jgi:hypothetical protein
MSSVAYYQIIAILPGAGTKSIINKTESQVMDYVISFKIDGTIKEGWGDKDISYQVYELRVYQTKSKYDKKTGVKLEDFIKGERNKYSNFEKRVSQLLNKKETRVFIIMPIQGKEFGNQNEQRIYKEFDQRFIKIRDLLKKYNCTAIRIDKEYPLDQLVARIKQEIERAHFIIADLTEERPSCYFEAGYAEALKRSVIYIASEYSIIDTKNETKIHFDVHMMVNKFSNHDEMIHKLKNAIDKNKKILFKEESTHKEGKLLKINS